MKDIIQSTLEQAEALYNQLKSVGDKLDKYDGEHLTEAMTEYQLDRWTQERGLDESMEAAVMHMAKVLHELRWIHDELEK